MKIKGFPKHIFTTTVSKILLLLLLCSVLTDCRSNVPENTVLFGKYLEDTENGLIFTSEQSKWLITTRYLPEKYLSAIEQSTQTVQANQPFSTCTFKVRVRSSDNSESVLTLLEKSSAGKNLSQIHELLAYHMSAAAHLQVGTQVMHPISAYVEMTPQEEQYLDIIFVFPMTSKQLENIAEVDFMLDKVFFLPDPIRVPFATTDILTAAS